MSGIDELLAIGNGSASAVAIKLTESGHQCSRQLIEYWVKRGRIPAERVIGIEAAVGIPRQKLRPDLYQIKKAG